MQLDLSPEERAALAETLTSFLSDLSYEIGNTDSFDFRANLKRKAALLNAILAKLVSTES